MLAKPGLHKLAVMHTEVVATGGKTGWAPGAWSIFHTRQAVNRESLTPLADNAALHAQPDGHLAEIDPVSVPSGR